MAAHELHARLRVAAGFTAAGRVDTQAAADLLGVSRRTVQRWCAGGPQGPGHLPVGRVEQVLQATRPSDRAVRQEALDADRARRQLAKLGVRGRQAEKRQWAARGWDSPHLVYRIDHRLGEDLVHQVATARMDSDQSKRLLRRDPGDAVRVPTRFHAVMVTHQLLDQVDRWRVLATPHLSRGATQVWLDAAPAVDLFATYQQALDTPASRTEED